MKKTSKLVILALLVVGAVMTLCACGLVADAQSIEIVNPPKQDYVTTDTEFDWTGFQIKVTKNDGSVEYLTYAQLESAANFTVSAFDNSAGKHTAIITYMGVSVAFEYTVNAGLFAGGDGTEANPYQIATAEQFYRLAGDQKGNYFVLINDIDFNNNVETIEWAANFTLNGNGYALEGVNNKLFSGFSGEISSWGVMNYSTTVLNDIDMHITANGGIAARIAGAKYVEISNVNIYGVHESTDNVDQNKGIITSWIEAETTVLNNISIYADMITYTAYGSPFVGASPYNGCGWTIQSVQMNNCDFYGTAQGQRIGLFMGNAGNNGYVAKNDIDVSITNSYNYGTIIANTVTYLGAATFGYEEKLSDIEEAFGSNVPGLGVTKSFNAMTTTTADGFKFDAVTNAVEYKVFVYIWGSVYDDADYTMSRGTNTATVYSNTLTSLDGFALAFGNWTLEANAGLDTVKCIASTKTNVGYMKADTYKATYVVFALDAQGNVIGFGVAATK